MTFWHGVQVRRVSDSGQVSDGGAAGGGIGGRLRAMFGRWSGGVLLMSWDEYLEGFHATRPGITELVLRRARWRYRS